MSTEKDPTGITAPRDTRRQIEGLVQRFARNLDVYTRPDYKETQVRVEFIDPFFEALGWDVRNVQGYAELCKDVVHEDAIKVSGATKAPDYCFRVGGVRKFFLEAKKPSVAVKGEVGPAYQLHAPTPLRPHRVVRNCQARGNSRHDASQRAKAKAGGHMPKKKYRHAIANWPAEERPREKLLLKGPDTLTDAELLAIFLRIGVKGKSAIDLAQELLSRFCSLRGLYAAPVEELRTVLGVGDAKIAQFKAVVELSRRYLLEGIENRPYLECSEDIYTLLYQELRDLDREVLKVIMLNGRNEVLSIVDAFEGSLTASAIYPREVVKLALRHSAAALVFAHNHPSGEAVPSNEDKRITRDLVLAARVMGMKVHDHLIIGDNEKFSFADAGLIDEYDAEFDRRSAAW